MNILFIEDDENLRFMLAAYLEKVGYNVITASNLKNAMNLIVKVKYDIVISDYMLPDGTGLDFLNFIKEKEPFAVVIFLTAYDNKELLIELINKGAYGYLSKPFRFYELDILLKKAIDYKLIIDENLKLTHEILKKNILEEEMKFAKLIQDNFLLNLFPLKTNFEVYGHTVSANIVGGDFYDIIPFSEDEIIIVIGDIAGKGLRASIIMAIILNMIRTLINNKFSIENIMSEINETILKHQKLSMQCTCFIGILGSF